jgi:hypothetical protein
MMNEEMTKEYADQLAALLPLARVAYGSRSTKSPQHDASREYTRVLLEFYSKGGSLLKMASILNVTYAGMRRRIITDQVAPHSKVHSKATPDQVLEAVANIKNAKLEGVDEYHEAIRREYEDNKVSLAKIAKGLGLSSANPLYYAVSRAKLKK